MLKVFHVRDEVCGFEKWYVNVESLSLTSLSKLMGQRKQG